MLSRRGTSLVELLIAMTLGALVLATAGGSYLRQQRGLRWVGALSATESQMRPIGQLMLGELSQLDAAAGDVVPREASDTTLQIRAVVASSISCDSTGAAVTMLPEISSAPSIVGASRAPAVGDSLWLYAGDSLGWMARRVANVGRVASSCQVPTTSVGLSHRLTLDRPIELAGGAPLRLTRQERYAFYRASDGGWYLGVRDWSDAIGQFAAPQPVAGPFLRGLRDGATTGFRYYDRALVVLAPNGTNERDIAMVRVTSLMRVPPSGARDTVRRDSVDVAVVGQGGG